MSDVDERAVADAADPPPVDGRTARAHRTRDAIVEACVGLVNQGDPRPTAPRIAEEAGVSVRSVFQHFDDLETLFAMVAERALHSLAGLVGPVDPTLSLEERITTFTTQRTALLEALTPIRRAANVHAPASPAIQARIADGHVFLRSEVEQTFGVDLADDPAERRLQLDMLDVAASWASWEQLRAYDGRSIDEAAVVVAALLRAVLTTR